MSDVVDVVEVEVPGQKGSQGAQGADGGEDGAQGSQGAVGAQGVVGTQGSNGSQGATGNQGANGTVGNQGAQGDLGANGSQGVTGNQGAVGNQGATGPQGVTGNQGSTGNQGATGGAGAQGSNGAQGSTGSTGAQGATGNTGAQGLTGSQGSNGVQGSQGNTGAQGSTGLQGNSGAVGAQGLTGPQGLTGTQGAAGAVGSQGLTGTQGANGAQGSTGAQGLTGNQGANGTQGSTGSQGLTGSQGATGLPSGLTPTTVKTSTYAAAAGDLVKADTSGGGFTTTLPTTPADKTLVAVDLVTAGNTLTVAAGGSAKFNSSSGSTSKAMATAGQTLLVQYQQTGDLWIVLVDVLASLTSGTYTSVDTGTAGQAKVQLNDDIGAKTLTFLNGGTLLVDVDYMTVAALAAVTYANGSSGVGATLTATGNGVMANVDGITPVNGDTLFVGHQATGAQNGPYLVSDIGSGGTPFVLTRLTSVDTAAELANAVFVVAARGSMFGGHPLKLRGGTYVLGTTSIFGQSLVSLGDVIHGGRRDRLAIDEDFDTFDTFSGTTGQRLPGSKCTVVFSGAAAAATQIEATDLVQGSIDLATGTSTTGKIAVQAGFIGVVFDAFKRWDVYFRAKIPTLSDGTNTFGVKIGFQSSADGAPTDGAYFQARSGVTNWEAVTRAAGVETATVIDTGVAQGTGFVNIRVHVPGDGHVYFILGAAQVADLSANIAATNVWPVASILKSAGGTSRSLRVDTLAANLPNGRGSNFYAP